MIEYLDNLIPHITTKTRSGNYNIILDEIKPSLQRTYTIPKYFLKVFLSSNLPPDIEGRLSELQRIQGMLKHERICPILGNSLNSVESKTYILYRNMGGWCSLQNLLKQNKGELTTVKVDSIIYQVIIGLEYLQTNKFNHLRLNPSSILIKMPLPGSVEHPVVILCDFGLAIEDNNHNLYYQSRKFIQDLMVQRVLTRRFQQKIQYDFWSLGCIVWEIFRQSKPFFKKKGLIFQQYIFDKQYHQYPSRFLNDEGVSVSECDQKWLGLVKKCWNIEDRKFVSWKQARQYYQKIFLVAQIDKIPIYQLYEDHMRFMYLICKIYEILRNQLKLKLTKCLRQQNIRQVINKLSKRLLKLALLIHNNYFKNNLITRCLSLGDKFENIQKLSNQLQQEYQYITNNQFQSHYNNNIKFIQTLQEYCINLMTRTDPQLDSHSIIKRFIMHFLHSLKLVKINISNNQLFSSDTFIPFYHYYPLKDLSQELGYHNNQYI